MTSYKARLLLLESDSDSRTLLRLFFEEQELSVDCAYTVAEAEVLIAARSYEMVLVGTVADPNEAVAFADSMRQAQKHAAIVNVSRQRDLLFRVGDFLVDPLGARRLLRPLANSARELLSMRVPSLEIA